jgi:hypothetical protein
MEKTELYARSTDGLTFVKSTYSENERDMCVEVAAFPDGARVMRDSNDRSGGDLRFTSDEWAAFCAGVRDGEF